MRQIEYPRLNKMLNCGCPFKKEMKAKTQQCIYDVALMKSEIRLNSTFMCVASFGKNCSEGRGKFPNKRHLYYRCTACHFSFG